MEEQGKHGNYIQYVHLKLFLMYSLDPLVLALMSSTDEGQL